MSDLQQTKGCCEVTIGGGNGPTKQRTGGEAETQPQTVTWHHLAVGLVQDAYDRSELYVRQSNTQQHGE